VLVLGGSGFIGRHLVRALAARGLGIRVATRSLGSARIALAGLPVELVEGDPGEAAFVDAALDNIEVVYDLTKADMPLMRNIVACALVKGVKRFIYTGSIDTACEALLMRLHCRHGFPVVIFRPGIVIGKGCPPAHRGDGRHPLPLVMVEDAAQALALALDRPGIDGQTFLLTGEPLDLP
jgi:nucleoside-diphosphate-sugar epimerase